jgi:drug/metabolite transporter (DMT)-like permease
MNPEEEKWRQRAAIVNWMRIGGLLIALLGLVLMRGGVITDEPWPILGAILLVSGLIDATLSPKIMKRMFDAEDQRP